MVSVNSDLLVSSAVVRLCSGLDRGHISTLSHRVTVVCLFLAFLLGDYLAAFSLQTSLKCTPDTLIEYPKRRPVSGKKEIENIFFTKRLIGIFACINVFVLLLLLI